MIHEQRELYDYWRACAKGGRLPCRADINPAAISSLLPGISILDAGKTPEQIVYRLAGTRLREIFGKEVTGKSVFDLEFGEKRQYWLTVYRKVIDEAVPMQGAIKGPVVSKDHVVLFWMRLPLSNDDNAVNKILCHDVTLPLSVAYELDAAETAKKNAG
ncbi:MAG: PAS domain-containing protein [Rhodomicrobium sp.]|nr:PAS domain-containing protein [Rhodomicrobium sp.]